MEEHGRKHSLKAGKTDASFFADKIGRNVMRRLRHDRGMLASYANLIIFVVHILVFMSVIALQRGVEGTERYQFFAIRDALLGFSNATTENGESYVRDFLLDFDTFEDFLRGDVLGMIFQDSDAGASFVGCRADCGIVDTTPVEFRFFDTSKLDVASAVMAAALDDGWLDKSAMAWGARTDGGGLVKPVAGWNVCHASDHYWGTPETVCLFDGDVQINGRPYRTAELDFESSFFGESRCSTSRGDWELRYAFDGFAWTYPYSTVDDPSRARRCRSASRRSAAPCARDAFSGEEACDLWAPCPDANECACSYVDNVYRCFDDAYWAGFNAETMTHSALKDDGVDIEMAAFPDSVAYEAIAKWWQIPGRRRRVGLGRPFSLVLLNVYASLTWLGNTVSILDAAGEVVTSETLTDTGCAVVDVLLSEAGRARSATTEAGDQYHAGMGWALYDGDALVLRGSGDVKPARLRPAFAALAEPALLTFKLHAYGDRVAYMNLEGLVGGTWEVLFRTVYDQGHRWHEVRGGAGGDDPIRWRGFTYFWTGDIAIDDVAFAAAAAPTPAPTASEDDGRLGATRAGSATRGDADFLAGQWQQDPSSEIVTCPADDTHCVLLEYAWPFAGGGVGWNGFNEPTKAVQPLTAGAVPAAVGLGGCWSDFERMLLADMIHAGYDFPDPGPLDPRLCMNVKSEYYEQHALLSDCLACAGDLCNVPGAQDPAWYANVFNVSAQALGASGEYFLDELGVVNRISAQGMDTETGVFCSPQRMADGVCDLPQSGFACLHDGGDCLDDEHAYVAAPWACFDKQTLDATVQMATVNVETGLLTYIEIVAERVKEGGIRVTDSYRVFDPRPYDSDSDVARAFLELANVAIVLALIFVECRELWHTYAVTGGIWDYVLSGSNFIDVLGYVVSLVMFAEWLHFWRLAARIRPLAHYDAYADIDADQREDVKRASNSLARYDEYIAVAMIMMAFQLLKNLDFHPRIGMISRTVRAATTDLTYFIIVFLFVLEIYAFLGVLLHGKVHEDFENLFASSLTMMKALCGMFDDSAIEVTFINAAFYWSFMVLSFFLLLNSLLAIIVEAYTSVVEAGRAEQHTDPLPFTLWRLRQDAAIWGWRKDNANDPIVCLDHHFLCCIFRILHARYEARMADEGAPPAEPPLCDEGVDVLVWNVLKTYDAHPDIDDGTALCAALNYFNGVSTQAEMEANFARELELDADLAELHHAGPDELLLELGDGVGDGVDARAVRGRRRCAAAATAARRRRLGVAAPAAAAAATATPALRRRATGRG
ncbi:hypothetical protein JL722_14156 [Aureococcus anophagefferens]|nr:hypothetical protein JL722_14156 [Aureococcus anophagefferens]